MFAAPMCSPPMPARGRTQEHESAVMALKREAAEDRPQPATSSERVQQGRSAKDSPGIRPSIDGFPVEMRLTCAWTDLGTEYDRSREKTTAARGPGDLPGTTGPVIKGPLNRGRSHKPAGGPSFFAGARARAPVNPNRLSVTIRHRAPQPSGPLPSGGNHYVTSCSWECTGTSSVNLLGSGARKGG